MDERLALNTRGPWIGCHIFQGLLASKDEGLSQTYMNDKQTIKKYPIETKEDWGATSWPLLKCYDKNMAKTQREGNIVYQ